MSKPPISFLNPLARQRLAEALIVYLDQELDCQIGLLAAEGLLDHFLDQAGKDIYNQAVDETLTQLRGAWADWEVNTQVTLKK